MSLHDADRRWLRRTVVATRGRIGSPLPLISKAADRGIIWPILAGALASRRSTRNAGAAGIAAVLVTSTLTWPLERTVQRDRPSPLTALVARGSTKRPSSSSFPSTHAANAFAFAAAAATVRPTLGIVLVPPAVAIGVARVGIGHHYPSDVIAGAGIGACVGTGIGLLLRNRTPASLPASPAKPACSQPSARRATGNGHAQPDRRR